MVAVTRTVLSDEHLAQLGGLMRVPPDELGPCLLVMGLDLDGPANSGPAFVGGIGLVALTYIVLAITGSFVSGRVLAQSRSRRMRPPWERGSTEWQPPAWTYHIVEDILIGAAVFSAVVSLVLFLTVGGFGE